MDIQIIVDSCCDLTPALRTRLRVSVASLKIDVGSIHYVDDERIDTKKLIADMKAYKNAPSTACPSPDEYAALMEKSEESFVVTLSGKLSGSYNAACVGREMVLENISFLLNSFLRCSAYDHVIFCWVLHRREIWEDLLRRLTEPYVLRAVSLVCTPETLRSRLEGDIRAGKRIPDVLDRSLAYLPLYDALDIRHLDVTALTPRETAECIRREGGA